jgi:hypothetical protein
LILGKDTAVASLHRTLLWNALYTPGAEYFNLWQEDNGWRLEGLVTLVLGGYPTQVRYTVACDSQWQTRAVEVEMQSGATTRRLQLTVDERQRWRMGEEEVRVVRGCHDVDLSVTPSTNVLPIRRLNLPVGENQEVTAAWLRFPELTVEPLVQKYTHIAEHRYWYQSNLSDKIWDLEVDDLGLVRRYADGWMCEAVI